MDEWIPAYAGMTSSSPLHLDQTMPLFSLAFLCGIILLQFFTHLPNENWVIGILLFVVLLFFLRKYFKPALLLSACGLGFCWALLYAHFQTSWTLGTDIEGKTVYITGTIDTIPHEQNRRTSFLFSLDSIQIENRKENAHGRVRLSWQHAPLELYAGDQWLLSVRLKRIHGMRNPGSFDYEAWSLQQGIRAAGYVVLDKSLKSPIKLSNAKSFSIHRVRQYFRDQIAKKLPPTHTSPWITALAIGERQDIHPESWEVLRNTGTNHLMAIAGLHIGFMSAFALAIVTFCWRRIPYCLMLLPAQHAGLATGLLVAVIYSALAGFSIPTQRACIMISSFLIMMLLRRKVMSWQALSFALVGVLLLNPLNVLSISFWLSFVSVAFIIYGMKGRKPSNSLWWKYGRIQWVTALGLIPISIWLFQQCSLVSFVANSIAIPWVGFLVVPLTLVGCFALLLSEKIGGFFLILADKILQALWSILTYLSQLSWSSWYQVVPDIWIIIFACAGMVILLLPIGFKGRGLGLFFILPLILYKPEAPKQGEVFFTLLDVGQGLSAVVQTQNHVLVFDTGAKLSENYDMGASVVIPFLRTIGVKKLDMLVVSHGDNDHSGGVGSLLKQLPVSAIKSSSLKILSKMNASYCLRGEAWEWDGVQFEFLYPSKNQLGLGNNSSCVLKITNGMQRILLTGDIEKWAEKELVSDTAIDLTSDILVAPHHGSKTSGENDFIDSVHPRVVLFPTGYRNRYHFPHPSVLKKYEARHVIPYNTADSGAIQFTLDGSNKIPDPALFRLVHWRYWND